MHGSRFADESAAKLLKDVIHGDEDLVKTLDVQLVVALILAVLGERRCRWCLVWHGPDLGMNTELGKILKHARVEISYGEAVVKCKVLVPAIAHLDLEH